jgi:transcriptional regulator with XRE-family HTH domain
MQLKKPEKNWKLWIAVKSWGHFAQLAYQADINVGTLSRITNGYFSPTKEQMERICQVLKKSPDELGLQG